MSNGIDVLIVGSGAREHAISHAYEKSPQVNKIIVAPGNDFIKYRRRKEVVIDKECSLKSPHSFLTIAKKYNVDLVDVAQDDAIAEGTVDLLVENGFQVFGPTKNAARIEWDKRWSREFMKRQRIQHPNFAYFDSEKGGIDYVKEIYERQPDKLFYIKASGLCSGKALLNQQV